MVRKYLTASRLKKELTLLEHGFYDIEVNEHIQKEIVAIHKKHPEYGPGLACTHGSIMCTDCCRRSWFKKYFRW